MSIIEFTSYLSYLAPVLLTVALIRGLFSYKNLGKESKAIVWYVLMLLLVDVISRLFWKLFGNNHILLLVYSFLELLFAGYFYLVVLSDLKHKLLKGLVGFGLLYIIYEIFVSLYIKTDVGQFQPYSKVVDDFVVILLSLTFFYENISKKLGGEWRIFNLNIAFLIYFTVNLIVFLPFNFLVNENSGLKFYVWFLNMVANIVFYAYIIFFIWNDKLVKGKDFKKIVEK